MSIVEVVSTFALPIDHVWCLLKRGDTLAFVTAGQVRFQGLPEEWCPGKTYQLQVSLRQSWLGWTLWQDYAVTVTAVDANSYTIVTSEQGAGYIRSWQHVMQLEAISPTKCRYTDVITIDAGWRTWGVRRWAMRYYRDRHERWQELIATEKGTYNL